MTHLHLNLDLLLRFYDDSPESRLHQSSFKSLAGEEVGLALFEHFLVSELNRDPVRLKVPCTIKGARLDGWVKVTRPESVLYQVEVKSWSMHSYGHRRQRLPLDASTETVQAYKIETWKHYWDDQKGSFNETSLNKVLIPMKVPARESGPIAPVACLWSAVHPNGSEAPFFQISLNGRSVEPGRNGAFDKLHVFSASAYLRNLRRNGIASIRLELPNTKIRMKYLNSMFSESNDNPQSD